MVGFTLFAIIIVGLLCFFFGYAIKSNYVEAYMLLVPAIAILIGLGIVLWTTDYQQYDKIAGCIDNGGTVQWCVDNNWHDIHDDKNQNSQFLKHFKYEFKKEK